MSSIHDSDNDAMFNKEMRVYSPATPTPPDFRALCAELADSLEAWQRGGIPTERLSGAGLVARARAALEAQPEPVGPTDKELRQVLLDCGYHPENRHLTSLARHIVARWGRPAIEPISVSERLPTEFGLSTKADCDVLGRCWAMPKYQPDGKSWELVKALDHKLLIAHYSHWLPHWALPIPRREENLYG